MQVLAVLKTLPSTTMDHIGPLIKPEAAELWTMVLDGTLRSTHFIQAPAAKFPEGVVLLLETDSPEKARVLIDRLPMVSHGLVEADVLPLAPFTSYAALFAALPTHI